jgi:hypothetical protein
MSGNREMATTGIEALNETYRTGDVAAWRRQVERYFGADVTLETGGMAFTEGEWHGHDGVVAFVANQMDVLEGMWIRIDELIEVGESVLIAGITFGGPRYWARDVARERRGGAPRLRGVESR